MEKVKKCGDCRLFAGHFVREDIGLCLLFHDHPHPDDMACDKFEPREKESDPSLVASQTDSRAHSLASTVSKG